MVCALERLLGRLCSEKQVKYIKSKQGPDILLSLLLVKLGPHRCTQANVS